MVWWLGVPCIKLPILLLLIVIVTFFNIEILHSTSPLLLSLFVIGTTNMGTRGTDTPNYAVSKLFRLTTTK